jgi:hypothetical protein
MISHHGDGFDEFEQYELGHPVLRMVRINQVWPSTWIAGGFHGTLLENR